MSLFVWCLLYAVNVFWVLWKERWNEASVIFIAGLSFPEQRFLVIQGVFD